MSVQVPIELSAAIWEETDSIEFGDFGETM